MKSSLHLFPLTTTSLIGLAIPFLLSTAPYAHAADCQNFFTSSTTVPTGFGAAYNFFSTAKELLIMGSNCETASFTVTVGATAGQYVYKQGYSWNGTGWTAFTLTGPSAMNDWFTGPATVSLPLTPQPEAFVVGFVCQQVNGVWKCGCSDEACTTPTWQLQRITNDSSSSPTVQPTPTPQSCLYQKNPDESVQPRTTIEGTFLNPGISIRWNYATSKLAYTKQLEDGYYDIFISDVDGKNERPLTVNHPDLPNKNQGVPNWHPSGKYLVFVAEKSSHAGDSNAASPGFGGYSDMWLITDDGKKVWQLTNEPNDIDHATLLPVFSHDGKKITWAERIKQPDIFNELLQSRSYVIKVADFVESPESHLENIQQYQPDGDAFYEVSDFSPDGKQILFTSNFKTRKFLNNQIYLLDLESKAITDLTSDGYNEYPSFTPDGQAIVYMANYQVDWLKGWLGTDWWIMNYDGTNKRRLTFMNKNGDPESDGNPMWPCGVAWSPDQKWFYGDVQTDLISQAGKIIKVRVDCR